MSWFLTTILKFLSGGALDRVFKYLEQKQKNELDSDKIKSELIKEAINAEIESRKIAAEIIKVEQGNLLASLVRPLFAYPLIIYWCGIVLDSMFHLGWKIAALPSPMDEWAGWIIASYFISRPIEKITRNYLSQGKK